MFLTSRETGYDKPIEVFYSSDNWEYRVSLFDRETSNGTENFYGAVQHATNKKNPLVRATRVYKNGAYESWKYMSKYKASYWPEYR